MFLSTADILSAMRLHIQFLSRPPLLKVSQKSTKTTHLTHDSKDICYINLTPLTFAICSAAKNKKETILLLSKNCWYF